jgi:carboxyl-terminal processing protease
MRIKFSMIINALCRQPFATLSLSLAFLSLASCGLINERPSRNSIAAANQIAVDILAHRTAADLGTKLSSPALATFARVFDRVRRDYVRPVVDSELLGAAQKGLRDKYPKPQGVEDDKLVMAAIDGMLQSLDKYSSYLDPPELKAMRDRLHGKFGGLGIRVRKHEKGLLIVSPIEDTPAEKAQLKSGDVITHAGENPLAKISLSAAVRMMRGEVGTKIRLTIARENMDTFAVTITRDIIKVAGVRSRLENDVGYIRVSAFNRHVSRRVVAAVDDIHAQAGQKLRGFVLDFRNNPGGPFDEAVYISDSFLESGRIVSTRGRDNEEHHDAKPGDLANGLPIVVLINGGSASASEIVAGALHDHHRAVLMGKRSFGKGTVQRLIPLGGHDALRLTTAIYLTPSGKSVDGGIEPDKTVESDPDREGDEQLNRAIEMVREMFNARS